MSEQDIIYRMWRAGATLPCYRAVMARYPERDTAYTIAVNFNCDCHGWHFLMPNPEVLKQNVVV